MKKTYTNPTLEILNPIGEVWNQDDSKMNFDIGLPLSSEEDDNGRQ